ncbi:hypothetical protein GF367_00660 [Candidatus Woesearchaeota archaeon]|nr:hypothetical protein [Candidatus Woesearchaeota archaeon]
MKQPPKQLIKRSFFGKGNCFKYLLYDDGTVMFHFGTESSDKWQWKKVKMNDAELGEILLVLEQKKAEASFYHSFGEGKDKQTTQIWVNTKPEENAFFIKVKELSKSFNQGEQRVLAALINHSLVRINLQF